MKIVVSASAKQKYDRDFSDPDISSFSNYDSLPAADQSSKNDFDTNSIDSISIQSDRNDLLDKYLPNSTVALSSSTGHIKRYKMERKNSQQSQHGKQESSMASGSGCGGGGGGGESIKWECDPCVQELIGDSEIRVKIAGINLSF